MCGDLKAIKIAKFKLDISFLRSYMVLIIRKNAVFLTNSNGFTNVFFFFS